MNIKAFPSTNEIKLGDFVSKGNAGMDLRDYFAAKAMQSIVKDLCEEGIYCGDMQFNLKVFANAAYEMAEAMMEARNK